MPTNFLKGDVLDEAKNGAGARALAFAAEGGIVAAVKKEWPAFAEALDKTKSKSVEPGEVFEWSDGELTLFALGIQRSDGKPKVPWISRALGAAIERADEKGVVRILVPRLGGDWPRVKKVLEELGATTTIDLVVFEQFVRKATTTG